jgi:tetratricopeptide (TPR) repeat protein
VNPNYFEAYVQLGTLYALKKKDLAIDYFNAALNLESDNTEVLYSLGMYYQEAGKYEKAIQSYTTILDREPDFYIAPYNIGYIYLVYLKDFERAIDYFTQTLSINPEYVEAYYNRGFAYELLKDADRSWNDYKKTLELYPNYEKAIEGLNRIDAYRDSEAN